MKYMLFDSNEQYKLRDEYFENWEKYFPGEEKPSNKRATRIARKAWEKVHQKYADLLWSLNEKKIHGYLYLQGYGYTGTSYDPDVDGLVDQDDALLWGDGSFSVWYDRGDICVCRDDHHGYTECKLTVIKPLKDVDVTGLDEDELSNLQEFYSQLEDYDYDDEHLDQDILDRIFSSSVQYFKEFLSEEALQDFEERKAQNSSYYCD